MGKDCLVGPFLNALPTNWGRVDSLALEDKLEAFVARAARERSELSFDRLQFVAYAARRLGPDRDLNSAVAKVRAGDLLLSFACLAREPRALSELDTLVRRIAASDRVARALPGDDREDVAQQVLETLLTGNDTRGPALEQYRGRGPLRAWVAVVCARQARVTNRGKERGLAYARVADAFMTCDTRIVDDPELEMIRKQSAQAFEVALAAALRGLDPRDNLVLHYWYVDGVSINELGHRIHVHRNTAARLLKRASRRLLTKARIHLGEGPGGESGCRGSLGDRLSSMFLGALDSRP